MFASLLEGLPVVTDNTEEELLLFFVLNGAIEALDQGNPPLCHVIDHLESLYPGTEGFVMDEYLWVRGVVFTKECEKATAAAGHKTAEVCVVCEGKLLSLQPFQLILGARLREVGQHLLLLFLWYTLVENG